MLAECSGCGQPLFLGWRAGARRSWAFVLGLALYALDALIFVLAGDWLSVGFHAFVLFGVWSGYSSLRALPGGAQANPVTSPPEHLVRGGSGDDR